MLAVLPDPTSAAEAHARIQAIQHRQAVRAQQNAELRSNVDRARLTALALEAAEQHERATAAADRNREQAHGIEVVEREREDDSRDPRRIMARISADFGVSVRDIDSPNRTHRVLHARFAAIHAIRQANPHFSLNRIGLCVGGRDHSSVLSALRKMARVGVPQPPARNTVGGA